MLPYDSEIALEVGNMRGRPGIMLVAFIGWIGCGTNTESDSPDASAVTEGKADQILDAMSETEVEVIPLPTAGACEFEYGFAPIDAGVVQSGLSDWSDDDLLPAMSSIEVAYPEPWPTAYTMGLTTTNLFVVMPNYVDDMLPFPRGLAWDTTKRCYRTPAGDVLLTEEEAFQLYRDIAEKTTGVAFDQTFGRRTVVGIRGAYPGTFAFHGDVPDRFNDTLVLLWRDDFGGAHVREFAGTTTDGVFQTGYNGSSNLPANRRYRYVTGWHRGYNALAIIERNYTVRDDSNHNGHWDSNRNGWLPPATPKDRDRLGIGHNIHVASVDGNLGEASIGHWSAGCQNIAGMANWEEFIQNAWTGLAEDVDYFLIDARDIDPTVWTPCVPDNTHACPERIAVFPWERDGSALEGEASNDVYDCDKNVWAGREVVALFTVDRSGTLKVVMSGAGVTGKWVRAFLLSADDPNACLKTGDSSFSKAVISGRYFVVVDSKAESEVMAAADMTWHVKVTFQ